MGLADEEGWDDPTSIDRYWRQLRQMDDTLPPEQAEHAKRSVPIPAAFQNDGYYIRMAHAEYMQAIGDPQAAQRLADLHLQGASFWRYWADYDRAPWGPWRDPATPLAQYLNALRFCDENGHIGIACDLRNIGTPVPQPADGDEVCAAHDRFRAEIARIQRLRETR
jgi:hypothetical protein